MRDKTPNMSPFPPAPGGKLRCPQTPRPVLNMPPEIYQLLSDTE